MSETKHTFRPQRLNKRKNAHFKSSGDSLFEDRDPLNELQDLAAYLLHGAGVTEMEVNCTTFRVKLSITEKNF